MLPIKKKPAFAASPTLDPVTLPDLLGSDDAFPGYVHLSLPIKDINCKRGALNFGINRGVIHFCKFNLEPSSPGSPTSSIRFDVKCAKWCNSFQTLQSAARLHGGGGGGGRSLLGCSSVVKAPVVSVSLHNLSEGGSCYTCGPGRSCAGTPGPPARL